jgi:hypothetical protein
MSMRMQRSGYAAAERATVHAGTRLWHGHCVCITAHVAFEKHEHDCFLLPV